MLLLVSCNGSASSNSAANWYQPATSVSWQWQLQGLINTAYEVEIYDIDLFDSSDTLIAFLHQHNKKVICYFSAGSYENWRNDADRFTPDILGKTLDGWAGERWLDIRSKKVQEIMLTRLDLAKQKGCDGVEPDNMDGYSNDSGFALNANDQLDYNRFIATQAHERNLSVGLKNDLEQIKELVDYFDFAVNEQCFEYNECDSLAPFIEQGKAVLNAEYKQSYVTDPAARKTLCDQSNTLKLSTLILPLNLDDSLRYSCLTN